MYMSARPWRLAPSVAWQQIGAEVVLVDVASGISRGLNGTASFLFTRVNGRTTSELATLLAEAYDIQPERAHRDVTEFLASLEAAGTLVAEEESP